MARISILSIASAIVFGHLYCVAFQTELWPFSSYLMFSHAVPEVVSEYQVKIHSEGRDYFLPAHLSHSRNAGQIAKRLSLPDTEMAEQLLSYFQFQESRKLTPPVEIEITINHWYLETHLPLPRSADASDTLYRGML